MKSFTLNPEIDLPVLAEELCIRGCFCGDSEETEQDYTVRICEAVLDLLPEEPTTADVELFLEGVRKIVKHAREIHLL